MDLYDNVLSKEAFIYLGQMLVYNKSLELIGLAKCSVSSIEQMSGLVESIGKFIMNSDEIEDYKNKEKEREAIINKNLKAKAKKQPEEPLPIMPNVSIVDGVY